MRELINIATSTLLEDEATRRVYGAVIYLHPDGSDSGRVDFFLTMDAAQKSFDRGNSLHGPHPNGAPRWRITSLVEGK